MVSLTLHGKDISGMSRKDRVKVMTNNTSRLDEYLAKQKKQHQQDEES